MQAVVAETIRETPKAWLLSNGEFEDWFPKSVVGKNDDGTFEVPVWFMKEIGW